MSQHPAFAAVRRADSSRSTSEDNPFYTPAERPDAQLGYEHDIEQGPYDPHPVGLSQEGDARPRSSTSLQAAGDRPSTPFSPMEMMGFGARSHVPSQVERQDFAQQPEPVANPFTSPEDREDEDVISPILPAKNKERRYSPMVHYPSWSEVSEFDFHDEGRRVRNTNSADTHFTDSWHASRERLDGRYEMA